MNATSAIDFIQQQEALIQQLKQQIVDLQPKPIADQIIDFGLRYKGTTYLFGARSGDTNKFDCSSFVQYVYFIVANLDLPRNSRQQSQTGIEVSINSLQKGDLVFFDTNDDKIINHVGIYTGKENGKHMMLHTFRNPEGVILQEAGKFWINAFVTARRIL
jgi:cell wall-associated NlpC family hydrolase